MNKYTLYTYIHTYIYTYCSYYSLSLLFFNTVVYDIRTLCSLQHVYVLLVSLILVLTLYHKKITFVILFQILQEHTKRSVGFYIIITIMWKIFEFYISYLYTHLNSTTNIRCWFYIYAYVYSVPT